MGGVEKILTGRFARFHPFLGGNAGGFVDDIFPSVAGLQVVELANDLDFLDVLLRIERLGFFDRLILAKSAENGE